MQNDAKKPLKMETPTHWFSPESTRRELIQWIPTWEGMDDVKISLRSWKGKFRSDKGQQAFARYSLNDIILT